MVKCSDCPLNFSEDEERYGATYPSTLGCDEDKFIRDSTTKRIKVMTP